jgi:hypothetical protein
VSAHLSTPLDFFHAEMAAAILDTLTSTIMPVWTFASKFLWPRVCEMAPEMWAAAQDFVQGCVNSTAVYVADLCSDLSWPAYLWSQMQTHFSLHASTYDAALVPAAVTVAVTMVSVAAVRACRADTDPTPEPSPAPGSSLGPSPTHSSLHRSVHHTEMELLGRALQQLDRIERRQRHLGRKQVEAVKRAIEDTHTAADDEASDFMYGMRDTVDRTAANMNDLAAEVRAGIAAVRDQQSLFQRHGRGHAVAHSAERSAECRAVRHAEHGPMRRLPRTCEARLHHDHVDHLDTKTAGRTPPALTDRTPRALVVHEVPAPAVHVVPAPAVPAVYKTPATSAHDMPGVREVPAVHEAAAVVFAIPATVPAAACAVMHAVQVEEQARAVVAPVHVPRKRKVHTDGPDDTEEAPPRTRPGVQHGFADDARTVSSVDDVRLMSCAEDARPMSCADDARTVRSADDMCPVYGY